MTKLAEMTGRHHMVLIHSVQNPLRTEMPILWLFIEGQPQVFQPLVDYLQSHQSKSLLWKRRVARSVGLFFDFSKSFAFDEITSARNRHSSTLQAFIQALQIGTIPQDGIDESGLFWAPMSANMVAETARHPDGFVAFMANNLDDIKESHPLKALADTFSDRPSDGSTMLRFLLTAKRLSSRSFMQHLKDEREVAVDQKRRSRGALGIESKAGGYRTVKAMSFQLISELMEYGFIKNGNATDLFEREDVTAKMIFILLVGGGLRRSEPLHMWFNDVTYPTIDGKERCMPVLRHPSQASTFIAGENMTRMQYLRQRGLSPRHIAVGKSMRAGWKNLPTDDTTATTQVYFIHQNLEQLFASYHHYYLNVRRELVTFRKARGEVDHPFLFVSNGEDRNTGRSYIGSPYSQKSFTHAFARALTRVERVTGTSIIRGKRHGTTPHALRHAYAMLLIKAGAPQKAIQKALHHRSILSQEVYTEPEWEDVNAALNASRTGEANHLLWMHRKTVNPFDQTEGLKQTWRY